MSRDDERWRDEDPGAWPNEDFFASEDFAAHFAGADFDEELEPEWFADAVDDALTAEERRHYEHELARNPELAARFESYRRHVQQLRALAAVEGRVDGGASLRSRILADAERAIPSPAMRGGRFAWIASMSLAAASVALFFVLDDGWMSSTNSRGPGDSSVSSVMDKEAGADEVGAVNEGRLVRTYDSKQGFERGIPEGARVEGLEFGKSSGPGKGGLEDVGVGNDLGPAEKAMLRAGERGADVAPSRPSSKSTSASTVSRVAMDERVREDLKELKERKELDGSTRLGAARGRRAPESKVAKKVAFSSDGTDGDSRRRGGEGALKPAKAPVTGGGGVGEQGVDEERRRVARGDGRRAKRKRVAGGRGAAARRTAKLDGVRGELEKLLAKGARTTSDKKLDAVLRERAQARKADPTASRALRITKTPTAKTPATKTPAAKDPAKRLRSGYRIGAPLAGNKPGAATLIAKKRTSSPTPPPPAGPASPGPSVGSRSQGFVSPGGGGGGRAPTAPLIETSVLQLDLTRAELPKLYSLLGKREVRAQAISGMPGVHFRVGQAVNKSQIATASSVILRVTASEAKLVLSTGDLLQAREWEPTSTNLYAFSLASAKNPAGVFVNRSASDQLAVPIKSDKSGTLRKVGLAAAKAAGAMDVKDELAKAIDTTKAKTENEATRKAPATAKDKSKDTAKGDRETPGRVVAESDGKTDARRAGARLARSRPAADKSAKSTLLDRDGAQERGAELGRAGAADPKRALQLEQASAPRFDSTGKSLALFFQPYILNRAEAPAQQLFQAFTQRKAKPGQKLLLLYVRIKDDAGGAKSATKDAAQPPSREQSPPATSPPKKGSKN